MQLEEQMASRVNSSEMHSAYAAQAALQKRVKLLSSSIEARVSHADLQKCLHTQQRQVAWLQQGLDSKVHNSVPTACFTVSLVSVSQVLMCIGSCIDSSKPKTGHRFGSIAKPPRDC